jgi:hypothetical protein
LFLKGFNSFPIFLLRASRFNPLHAHPAHRSSLPASIHFNRFFVFVYNLWKKSSQPADRERVSVQFDSFRKARSLVFASTDLMQRQQRAHLDQTLPPLPKGFLIFEKSPPTTTCFVCCCPNIFHRP